jgi:NADPH:quinone reductase-like Zn-dependent oxidoreductase
LLGVRGKELDDARSLGVSNVLAIDDDYAIQNLRLVDAIADTVGGDVAAKQIVKVKQSGSFWLCRCVAGKCGPLKIRQ